MNECPELGGERRAISVHDWVVSAVAAHVLLVPMVTAVTRTALCAKRELRIHNRRDRWQHPGTYLDGAAMCRADGIHVIAMTLRHDRIDNFWFTLLHEFCHVSEHLKGDTTLILDDLDLKSCDDIEHEADAFAQDTLIAPNLWQELASRSMHTADITSLADAAGIHPAIVAGRWQREHNEYRRFSKILGRGEVRDKFATRT